MSQTIWRLSAIPERGEYGSFDVWLSEDYLPVVLKTLLEFTIRTAGRIGLLEWLQTHVVHIHAGRLRVLADPRAV